MDNETPQENKREAERKRVRERERESKDGETGRRETELER